MLGCPISNAMMLRGLASEIEVKGCGIRRRGKLRIVGEKLICFDFEAELLGGY